MRRCGVLGLSSGPVTRRYTILTDSVSSGIRVANDDVVLGSLFLER